MAVHLIRVIREFSEHSPRTQRQKFAYSDVRQPGMGKWVPNTDILETETHVCIYVELAGVKREDITVKVTDGKLTIQGTRAPLCRNMYNYHQMEINCGEFAKSILLPQSLEHNEMTAEFRDGILNIHISKKDDTVEIPIDFKDEQEKGRSII